MNELGNSSLNDYSDLAHLKNTFIEAEYDYLLGLLDNYQNYDLVEYLNENVSSEELFKMAIERLDSIEEGKVKEEDLERVEGEITLILAAVQDKTLIKELVLTLERRETGGLSR